MGLRRRYVQANSNGNSSGSSGSSGNSNGNGNGKIKMDSGFRRNDGLEFRGYGRDIIDRISPA
ncbi:hypothetical protein J5226_24895 [Lysobacter sp. K5869]|uniref:hypothetical protein n=1 Tax=Lysobacter sp. K5869 TaxID=2820808 RepID=UPI001C060BE9|nr:hypothetical protein [Lysobacter sp. K5869]QWP76768.1 hypothetical protein J5226_24895 [Lysobacter sp. K5869]